MEIKKTGEEEEGAGRGSSSSASSSSSFFVPAPRLLEVNFAPDLGVAARFNPDLPGLLLREMLREEEGGEGGDGGDDEEGEEDGMFFRLF